MNQELLDKHIADTVKDTFNDVPLRELEGLPPPPPVKIPFSNQKLSYEDFSQVLLTRSNRSAPGLNNIPYKVYKRCAQISNYLFKIFLECFKKAVIPVQWRYAKEFFIPKHKTPSENSIKDFRPIALLNVEGKLFFSLISKRLEHHIIQKQVH